MGFKSFMKGLGKGVVKLAPIAGLVFPAYASAIDVSMRIIKAAEESKAKKTGKEKALFWTEEFAKVSPQVIAQIEQSTGKELVDEALFAEAMQDIRDAQVKMLKAFGDK